MSNQENTPKQSFSGHWKSSAMILGFGLLILTYLIAIDRQQWFKLKPATGTARAMAYASDTSHPSRR